MHCFCRGGLYSAGLGSSYGGEALRVSGPYCLCASRGMVTRWTLYRLGGPTFLPSKIPAKEAWLILIKASTEVNGTFVVGNHSLSSKGSGFLFHYSPPSTPATMLYPS